MTMLNVASVKDGIVMSADSCVSSGGANNQDKIYYSPYDNVAFMLYGYGKRYSELMKHYRLPNLQKNKEVVMQREKRGPIAWAKELIENQHKYDHGIAPTVESTGVVIVGYEDNEPTVCTFNIYGTSRRKAEGAEGELYRELNYPKVPMASMEVQIGGAKVTDNYRGKAPVHIFKGNFSLAFATAWEEAVGRAQKSMTQLQSMEVNEAEDYLINMIKATIEEVKQSSEPAHIGEPIDSLTINPDGIVKKIWSQK